MQTGNIRRARNVLDFVVLPLGFVLLAYLGVAVHGIFVGVALLFAVLGTLLSNRIRCPNCNTPVGWHTYRLLGFRFEHWSALTPRHCEHCGHDLTGREAERAG